MRRHTMPLLLLLSTGACTWWRSDDHVLVTSDPLGARITVDGTDTGQFTPARIAIGGTFGRNHTVQLDKRGFRPASRTVWQFTEGYTSKWIDGAFESVLPPLPLFWTPGDLVFPFGVRAAMVPHELHVKLYREGEPKLGFEVLAERAAAGGTPQ
jgi:hypothetical protein